MTRLGPDRALDWLKRGAPYEEIEAPGLLAALSDARQDGKVLFDMPLGRAFRETAHLIDAVVWIDIPADIALARKMRQLMPDPGAESGRYLEWLDGYLAAYPAVVAPAIHDQREKVLPGADLKVSAEASVEAILLKLQDLGVIPR
jgi:uridine kinase